MRNLLATFLFLPGLAMAQGNRPMSGADVLYSLTHPTPTVLPSTVLPPPPAALDKAGALNLLGLTPAELSALKGLADGGTVTATVTAPPPATTTPVPVSTPVSSGAFTSRPSTLQNVLYQLDAGAPASTANPAAGSAGLVIDASNNVIGEVLPDGNAIYGGNGKTLLVANGWSAGIPILRDTAAQLNSGYDGLVLPTAYGQRIFQASQSSDLWLAIRQTAPVGSELFRATIGGKGVKVFGAPGATDCALRIEANIGSANGNEPSGPLTACGQRQILEFTVDDTTGTISLFRNGTQTLTTSGGQINAFVPDNIEFANKCECDIAYAQQILGMPSIAQRQAELTRLVSAYPVDGTVSAITTGPAAKVPVAVDQQGTFLTTVNIPTNGNAANPLPLNAAIAPTAGLSLEAGATQLVGMRFGTATAGANITTGQQVRANFFTTTMEGNRNVAIGGPMDTGQGNNNAFAAVARTYAVGDPNDLIPVMTDGVYIRAACSANRTNCSPGNVYGGLLNMSQLGIVPGQTVKVRYRSPKGDHSWGSIWLFSINAKAPPAGVTDLFSAAAEIHQCGDASVYGIGNCMEVDINDNFSRFGSGTTTGKQVDYGMPDIYGSVWERDKFPHFTYGAQGNGYVTHLNAGPDYFETPQDLSTGFHDLILDWRADGNMNVFVDGKIIASGYEDFTKSVYYKNAAGQTVPVGMQLMLQNEAIPSFSPGAGNGNSGISDNDGLGVDGWTLAIQEVAVWQGNIANPQSFLAGTSNAYAGVTGNPQVGNDTYTISNTRVLPDGTNNMATHVLNVSANGPEGSSLLLVGLSTSNTVPPSCKGGTNAPATCYGATAFFELADKSDWISYRGGPAVIPALAAGTYYWWVQTPNGADHLASPTPYVK